MAHLYRVILPVTDLDGAAGFYGKVLEQPGQRVSPGRHYFDCEGTILACCDPKADGDDHHAMPIPEPVYIAVDDLDTTFRNARDAGARFSPDVLPDVGPLGEVALRPWGEHSFYASDPFGNPLRFVSRESVFRG